MSPSGRPTCSPFAGGPLIRRFLLLLAVLGAAALATPAIAGAFAEPARAPSVGDQPVHELPLTDAAGPGFEETLATDGATDLVGVKWNGSPEAEFTIEVQHDDGTWVEPYPVAGMDIGPDAGTPEARKVADRRGQDFITEPLAVNDPSQVRVRVADGLAADVEFVSVGGGAAELTDATAATQVAPPSTEPQPPATEPGPSPSEAPAEPTVSSTPDAAQASALTWTGAGLLTIAAVGWIVVNRRRARRLGLVVIVTVGALVGIACTPLPPGPPPPPYTGIHSRAEWGGPNVGPCAGYQDPPGVTYAVVHHTGGGPADNNYSDPAAKINGIYNYHVTSGGYCDIAYNFIIDKNGGIWEGRAGGVENSVFGAHALNYNAHSTGIVVLGDFTYIDPGQPAKNALVSLIAWKFTIHGVNPAGKPNNEVWAHRDVNATACPGDLFYDDLPWVRSQVLAAMGV